MRIFLGLLSGLLGMLAGWAGLAALIIAFADSDREGGTAMGAFFDIGPIGGLAGFILGVMLFLKFGLSRATMGPAETAADGAPDAPAATHISRPFAAAVLLIVAALAWWGWYEFIRSPYLSHGYMTLDLQFRLPPGATLPANGHEVHVDVTDGSQSPDVDLGETGWYGHDGNRPVILARAPLSYKTSNRVVHLSLPGFSTQSWQLDLASDPDPTRGYTPWQLSGNAPATKVELNYRLSADNEGPK